VDAGVTLDEREGLLVEQDVTAVDCSAQDHEFRRDGVETLSEQVELVVVGEIGHPLVRGLVAGSEL